MTTLRELVTEPTRTSRRILTRLRGTASPPVRPRTDEPTSDRFAEPRSPVLQTDPPGPTVVLLNDLRDQQNYGANALSDGLLSILSRSMPDATILPIPSHWLREASGDLRDMVDLGEGLRHRRAAFPVVADQFETVADEWLGGQGGSGARDFLARLEGADVVVLNGEGSIYRTNHSAVRELFIAWLAKERMGIPTAYVNGGLHLTEVMPILNPMVRKTFRSLDAVALRDPWSMRNLAEHVPGVAAMQFPDSAFILTADEANETEAVRALRSGVGADGYICFDPGAMPMDARGGSLSAMHELITALQQVCPTTIFVSSGPADDYIADIARTTGSTFMDTLRDYREYMALAAGARFVVTGRYHNVILAAIAGCPSIALRSSTHKVHGACEMLEGLVGSPYDGTDLRPVIDRIVQDGHRYVATRAELTVGLQEVCERRRTEVLGLGGLVSSLVRGRP